MANRRALLALMLAAAPATADAPGTLSHSFDVAVQRGGAVGPTFDDEAAIVETPAPAWTAEELGPLPAGADLAALARGGDGRWYFALDTFAVLGSVPAGPEDVVAWDGASPALAFDGSAAGVPAGAAIDAIAFAPGLGLLLSFDVAVAVGDGVAEDADLVAWDGSGLAIAFVAAAHGIPAGLDLDALDVDASDDSLLLSFDGGGVLGGVAFDDHDLLRFGDGQWSRIDYAGLAQAGTGAADLDAVAYASPGIFADGFETGGTGRWSDTV